MLCCGSHYQITRWECRYVCYHLIVFHLICPSSHSEHACACVTWRGTPRSSAIPPSQPGWHHMWRSFFKVPNILSRRFLLDLEFQSSCFTYYCEMKYFLHGVILRASELDGALLNKLMMNNKWLILSSCEPWRLAQSEKNIIRNTGIYSRGPKSLISHRQ